MKRLIASVLSLLILISLCPAVSAAQSTPIQIDPVYRSNPLYGSVLPQAVTSSHRTLRSDSQTRSETEYVSTDEIAGLLREAMKERRETVDIDVMVPNYSQESAQTLMEDAVAEAMSHTGVPTEGDYLLWQYSQWSCSASGELVGTTGYLTYHFEVSYYTDAQQEAEMDDAVADLLDRLDVTGKDDYTKILSIYDYICQNIDYDYDHENTYYLKYTAYAALIHGKAVCQGYATLFYRLALECGIDSRLIAGIGNGGPHGWNIARLDGLYYDLDATWDAGQSSYAYFLKCEANFGDHTRDEEYDTTAFHRTYPMSDSDYEVCQHRYTAETVAPTCTEQGYTVYTCTFCGSSYLDDHTAATGHSYVDGVCTQCGQGCDHRYDSGKVTTAATCTTEGIRTYTCTVCGGTKTGSVPATGHSYTASVTAPTCTEQGYTTYTCSVCGDRYTDDVTDTVDHSYGQWEILEASTCSEPGRRRRVCQVCGDTVTETMPLSDHRYENGVCTVCGDILIEVPQILSCYSKLQTSVKVTWTLVDGADGYELWRTTDPTDAQSWSRAKSITNGGTDRYTNQGLTEGVTYYYKIRAFVLSEDGSRICSNFSDVSYMPAAVVFDGPYSNATFRIRLRWQEVGGAHGYQIWRQNADGSFSIAKTIGDRGNVLTNDQGGTTAYSNTGLTAGESYTYKMRSFTITEDGRKIFGAFSDEVTIAVMPEIPAVTVTSPKAERAKVAWDSINGAAGYQIWISDSRNGTYKIAKSVTDPAATSATLYGLDSGKTYYVKVRAYTDVDGKKTFGGYSDPIAIQIK